MWKRTKQYAWCGVRRPCGLWKKTKILCVKHWGKMQLLEVKIETGF